MKYFGCTQAVLAVLQKELNVGSKDVFKARNALAEGVARRGETCGVLINNIMDIDTLVGRNRLKIWNSIIKQWKQLPQLYPL